MIRGKVDNKFSQEYLLLREKTDNIFSQGYLMIMEKIKITPSKVIT